MTVSIVMVGRNDDYGENFLGRMQRSVDVVLTLADNDDANIELVIVDWNPPLETSCLREALSFPESSGETSVKIVEVPPDVHESLDNPAGLPMFEYMGKNVGVRRASGEYVLTTNADIIFNESLVQFLDDGELHPGYAYRINRYDVDATIPSSASVDDILAICRDNVSEIATKNGRIRNTPLDNRVRNAASSVYRFVTGQTADGPWKAVRGIVNDFVEVVSPTQVSDVLKATPQEAVTVTSPIRTIDDLFTSAAGDCLLMARDGWREMGGYPEIGKMLHVDAVGLALAVRAGQQQAILNGPMRIYHQEHERGERDSRPQVKDVADVINDIIDPSSELPDQLRNPPDWGLRDHDLDVYQL